jgi:hypothetical protein
VKSAVEAIGENVIVAQCGIFRLLVLQENAFSATGKFMAEGENRPQETQYVSSELRFIILRHTCEIEIEDRLE